MIFHPRSFAVALSSAIYLSGVPVMAAEGLISVKSSYGPAETMKRLEAAVTSKGLTVFAHVDHAAGAAAVGLRCARPIF